MNKSSLYAAVAEKMKAAFTDGKQIFLVGGMTKDDNDRCLQTVLIRQSSSDPVLIRQSSSGPVLIRSSIEKDRER